MSSIYILQKEISGLGLLTKVGMTIRSGEDRANEYGGGGWVVIDEISVAVEDVSELKEIEGRIHDRLDAYRCDAAAGFGLTEVFTCSTQDAADAARAEIGSNAGDEDSVTRLQKRTNRMVEKKIIQAHAAELANFHMGRGRFQDTKRRGQQDDALHGIHSSALKALDAIGADATTFREMLGKDLVEIASKRAVAQREWSRKNEAAKLVMEERARKAFLEREVQQRMVELQSKQAAALEARKLEVKRRRKLVGGWTILTLVCLVYTFIEADDLNSRWRQFGQIDDYRFGIVYLVLLAIGTAVGVLMINRHIRAITTLQEDDDASPSD